MKKIKVFSVVLAVMLSVAGLFAFKPEPLVNQGYSTNLCTTLSNVPIDCLSSNHGNQCVISTGLVFEVSGCSTEMNKP